MSWPKAPLQGGGENSTKCKIQVKDKATLLFSTGKVLREKKQGNGQGEIFGRWPKYLPMFQRVTVFSKNSLPPGKKSRRRSFFHSRKMFVPFISLKKSLPPCDHT